MNDNLISCIALLLLLADFCDPKRWEFLPTATIEFSSSPTS